LATPHLHTKFVYNAQTNDRFIDSIMMQQRNLMLKSKPPAVTRCRYQEQQSLCCHLV